jgi:hypothetical protein
VPDREPVPVADCVEVALCPGDAVIESVPEKDGVMVPANVKFLSV